MSERAHFALLVQYNEWMNEKLFAAAATLPTEPWLADRGAFFSSIAGTLNHIVAGDTLWLRRFAMHPSRFAVLRPLLAWPAPPSLDAIYSSELQRCVRAGANSTRLSGSWCKRSARPTCWRWCPMFSWRLGRRAPDGACYGAGRSAAMYAGSPEIVLCPVPGMTT